jgi:hypothetical protein
MDESSDTPGTKLGSNLDRPETAELAAWQGSDALAVFMVLLILAAIVATVAGVAMGSDLLFWGGFTTVVACGLSADVAGVLRQRVAVADARLRRTWRRLALFEVLALFAWCVVAAVFVVLSQLDEFASQVLFAALWMGVGGGIVALFRDARNRHGLGAVAPEPPPELFSARERAEFWARPENRDAVAVVRRWRWLLYLDIVLVMAVVLTPAFISGDSAARAVSFLVGFALIAAALSWRLRKHYGVPYTLPPRPPPDEQTEVANAKADERGEVAKATAELDRSIELSGKVIFRPRRAKLLAVAYAIALFTPLLLGILIYQEASRPPTVATVLLVVASVIVSGAAFMRITRLRIEVSPNKIRIVNFSHSYTIPWEQVERVELGASLGYNASALFLVTQGHEAGFAKGVQFRLRSTTETTSIVTLVLATVTVAANQDTDPAYRGLLLELRRRAAAHNIPCDI